MGDVKDVVKQLKKMKIETRKIHDLLPYARNSRTHSDYQINQIAASIKEFGFTNPILITKDGEIIAGHGRVLAAMRLSMDEVPCITLDHLSDTQRRAYVIADNQLALNAGWDYEMLAVEVDNLRQESFDLDVLGLPSFDFTSAPSTNSIDDIEENLDGIEVTIKVKCDQSLKKDVQEKIKEALEDLEGKVSIE